MSTAAISVNVEEKLFQNRYRVDHGRPHIRIKQPEICSNECVSQACTFICPASCYTAEGNGTVTLITDGCLECGSCRVICTEHHNVDWDYPRGGHGILFKFG
ncbi:ferredoxin-like protein FixX [mine drainage metagenome]|jgi:ferredoxin like protein|uniref:Ferredoxin-like protein FixX n=1 Tax=mine drainage metagenome TaxID=410659 RepID=A0A1J5QB54_9ZZZZ